jgi:hypothetical protein
VYSCPGPGDKRRGDDASPRQSKRNREDPEGKNELTDKHKNDAYNTPQE